MGVIGSSYRKRTLVHAAGRERDDRQIIFGFEPHVYSAARDRRDFLTVWRAEAVRAAY
jgi:hypothetical protein